MQITPVGPSSTLSPSLHFGEITYLSADPNDPKGIPTIQLTKDLLAENSSDKNVINYVA